MRSPTWRLEGSFQESTFFPYHSFWGSNCEYSQHLHPRGHRMGPKSFLRYFPLYLLQLHIINVFTWQKLKKVSGKNYSLLFYSTQNQLPGLFCLVISCVHYMNLVNTDLRFWNWIPIWECSTCGYYLCNLEDRYSASLVRLTAATDCQSLGFLKELQRWGPHRTKKLKMPRLPTYPVSPSFSLSIINQSMDCTCFWIPLHRIVFAWARIDKYRTEAIVFICPRYCFL